MVLGTQIGQSCLYWSIFMKEGKLYNITLPLISRAAAKLFIFQLKINFVKWLIHHACYYLQQKVLMKTSCVVV